MSRPRNDHDISISSHGITRRLYTSHFLSAWNSRTFEFGAILFLATIYPGTLFYASVYALVRSAAATIFSSRVGAYIDRADRLVSIRHSIVWQRVSVIASCVLLFYVLLISGNGGLLGTACFAITIALACVEKLASLGNTVAVERDWVVVICAGDDAGLDRGDVNAGMRRIDLFCKLVAPVFISFVDAFLGTKWAVMVVLALSAVSVGVEYFAIAKVYHAVPALRKKSMDTVDEDAEPAAELGPSRAATSRTSNRVFASILDAIQPWVTYFTSPAFLPSLSLSLLYLTVLSTGPHWQTYLLATDYTALTVSLLRVLAVIAELSATLVAPYLMTRIGPVRAGLWSINWQLLTLAPAVALFYHLSSTSHPTALGGAILTTGMILSRLGLWSFDLSVQYLVQETTPPSSRSAFSAAEVGLQNLFEMLSFGATIVFSEPAEFVWPVLVSFAALGVAAGAFAGYVRRERGHILHLGRCLEGKGWHSYEKVGEDDAGEGLELETSRGSEQA